MHKNSNGFSIVETIIVLLVLCVLGVAGWYVWHHQAQHNPSKDTTTTTANTVSDTAKIQAFRTSAQTLQSTNYKNLTLVPNDPQYSFRASSDDGAVTYDISADHTVLLVDLVRAEGSAPNSDVQAYYNDLVSSLKQKDIVSPRESNGPSQGSLPMRTFNFRWGSYQCYLQLTYNGANKSVVEGVCNPYEDFQAANQAMLPYVKAIQAKATGSVEFNYSASGPTTEQSGSYEWTTIPYGQAGGYYLYKAQNSDNWTFFKQFSDTPQCSEFSSDATAAQAFHGVSCESAAGEPTTL